MRSPSFAPSRISTALMLLTPRRTGFLTAVSPSMTHALLPPPSSTNGPRSTWSTFLRVSITMRADRRWFWRRPGGCLPEKRRRLVTSPFTTSGETAATCASNGAPPALRICAGMPMPRSRAKLSGMRISTSNSVRSTTLSTGAFCATFARCAICTWPTWPSKGARSVSAATWRWISTTTARWRSASSRLLRVSSVGALARQADVALGVHQADVGALQRILRLRHVDLRHRAAFERALVTLQVARPRPGERFPLRRATCVHSRARASHRARRGWLRLRGWRAWILPARACCATRGCRSRRAPGPS